MAGRASRPSRYPRARRAACPRRRARRGHERGRVSRTGSSRGTGGGIPGAPPRSRAPAAARGPDRDAAGSGSRRRSPRRRRFPIAGREDASSTATMPPAPRLARVDEDDPGAPAVPLPPSPPAVHAGIHAHEALAQIAAQVALATRVHRAFLDDQAAAHRQFLEFRERAAATLLAAASSGVPRSLLEESLPLPASAQELATKGDGSGEGVARRGGLQRVSEARPMEVRSDRTPQPERSTDGILFDRHALEIHANGQNLPNLRPRIRRPGRPAPARPHARAAAAARRSRRAPGGRAPLAGHRHRLDGDRHRRRRLVPARQPDARGNHDRGRAGRPAARLLARRRRPQPRGARLPAARLRADVPRRAPRRRRDPALRDRRRRPRAARGGPPLLLPLHLHGGGSSPPHRAGRAGRLLHRRGTRRVGGSALGPGDPRAAGRGAGRSAAGVRRAGAALPARSSRRLRPDGPTSASAPASRGPRRTPAPRICRAAGCCCSRR